METQKVIKIDLFLNLSKSLNWILCTYGSWKQILYIFFYNGTLIVMHTHIPVFESIAFENMAGIITELNDEILQMQNAFVYSLLIIKKSINQK